MGVVGVALREFGGLVGLLTFGDGDGGGGGDRAGRPAPRRGAVHVAVQILATAAAVATVLGTRMWWNGTTGGPFAWFFAALLLALPLAMHWFAGPPRRGAGLAGGLAAGAVVAAAGFLLVASQASFWAGYAVVVAAYMVAGAVFGALAPGPAVAAPPAGPAVTG